MRTPPRLLGNGQGEGGGGQCARPISHLTPTWPSAEWEVPHHCLRGSHPAAGSQPNMKEALGGMEPPGLSPVPSASGAFGADAESRAREG